jgi:pyruvate carboxylase
MSSTTAWRLAIKPLVLRFQITRQLRAAETALAATRARQTRIEELFAEHGSSIRAELAAFEKWRGAALAMFDHDFRFLLTDPVMRAVLALPGLAADMDAA